MAHSPDLRIVAEGVETEAQFLALRSLDCEVPGRYAAPALTAEEFEKWYPEKS